MHMRVVLMSLVFDVYSLCGFIAFIDNSFNSLTIDKTNADNELKVQDKLEESVDTRDNLLPVGCPLECCLLNAVLCKSFCSQVCVPHDLH